MLCNFALLPKVDLDAINDTLLKKCLDKDIPVSVVTNYVNYLQYHKNFPIDKSKFSKKIQEEAIKLLILQIIDKEENINEIRTEFNEK